MKKIFLVIVLLFMGLLLAACGESMPVPNNLSIDNHVLKWDKVEKAEKYIVVIGSDEYDTTINEYDLIALDLEAGQYEIGVKVVIGEKTSKLSKKVTYVVEESLLFAPINIKLTGTVVSWDSVEGASGYIVLVNSTEHQVSSVTFDLATLDLPVGQYEIRVKAVALEVTSGVSQKVTFIVEEAVLAAPENVRLTGTVVSWDSVEEASGYIVLVNDVEHQVSSTTFDLGPLNLSVGAHNVKVKAVTSEKTSVYSNVVTYVILYEVDDVTKTKILKENNKSYELDMRSGDFSNHFDYEVYRLTVVYVEDYIEAGMLNNLPLENFYSLFHSLSKILINEVDLEDFSEIIAYVEELQSLGLTGQLLGQILNSKAIMGLKVEKRMYLDEIERLEGLKEDTVSAVLNYKAFIDFYGFIDVLYEYAITEAEEAAITRHLNPKDYMDWLEINDIIVELLVDINYQYYNDDDDSYFNITEVFRRVFALEDEDLNEFVLENYDNLRDLADLNCDIDNYDDSILYQQRMLAEQITLLEVFEEQKEDVVSAIELVYNLLILTKDTLNSEQFITVVNKLLEGESLTVVEMILLKNVMIPVIRTNIPPIETFSLVYQTLFQVLEDLAIIEIPEAREYVETISEATVITIEVMLDFLEIVDNEYITGVQEFLGEEEYVIDIIFYTVDYYEEFLLTVEERYADLLTEEEIEEIFFKAINYIIAQADEEEYEALVILEIIKDNYGLISGITKSHKNKLIPLIKSLKGVYESMEKVMEGSLNDGIDELVVAVLNLDDLLFGNLTNEDIDPFIDLLGQFMEIDFSGEYEEEVGHLIEILLFVNEVKSKVLLEASKLDAVDYLEHPGLETGDDKEIQYKITYYLLTAINNTLTEELKEEAYRLIDVLFADVLSNPEIQEILGFEEEELVDFKQVAEESVANVYEFVELLMSFDYDNLTEEEWEMLEDIVDTIFGSLDF